MLFLGWICVLLAAFIAGKLKNSHNERFSIIKVDKMEYYLV